MLVVLLLLSCSTWAMGEVAGEGYRNRKASAMTPNMMISTPEARFTSVTRRSFMPDLNVAMTPVRMTHQAVEPAITPSTVIAEEKASPPGEVPRAAKIAANDRTVIGFARVRNSVVE